MKTRERGSPIRTLMLALLVVAAAITSIVMIEHKKAADEEAQGKQDAQPLEVTPLMIKGDITEASWRDPDGLETPGQGDDDESARDVPAPFHSAETDRFDASLETTMKPLDGLGVFVSKSADDEDEEKEKD